MGLTKRVIDAAIYQGENNSRQVLWDDNPHGLGLRLYPSGRKAFVVSYRDAGGAKRLASIGDFGVFTLEQARERARDMLRVAESGADALTVRRSHKAAPTFADLTKAYEERHVPGKRSGGEDLRRITKHLGDWKVRKLESITREDVRQLVEAIAKGKRERGSKDTKRKGRPPVGAKRSGKPYEANRTASLLSKMFALALAWDLLPAGSVNPAAGVPRFKEVKRDRWITTTELPALAKAIDAEVDPYARAALWLYLLTGCRKAELLGARLKDVDTARAVLRLPETKTGQPHEVPLSAPALALLKELPKLDGNPFLFPGRKDGEQLESIRGPWDRVRIAAGVTDVRLHDLRRTVGSWLAQSGNSLHLIGRVLNHSNQSTTAVYARFAQDHVRDALEAHGAKLMGAAGKLKPPGVGDADKGIKGEATDQSPRNDASR